MRANMDSIKPKIYVKKGTVTKDGRYRVIDQNLPDHECYKFSISCYCPRNSDLIALNQWANAVERGLGVITLCNFMSPESEL